MSFVYPNCAGLIGAFPTIHWVKHHHTRIYRRQDGLASIFIWQVCKCDKLYRTCSTSYKRCTTSKWMCLYKHRHTICIHRECLCELTTSQKDMWLAQLQLCPSCSERCCCGSFLKVQCTQNIWPNQNICVLSCSYRLSWANSSFEHTLDTLNHWKTVE